MDMRFDWGTAKDKYSYIVLYNESFDFFPLKVNI